MRFFTIFLLLLFTLCSSLNAQCWAKKSLKIQKALDKHYADTLTSPLLKEDVASFRGHPFYAPQKHLIIKARFERTADAKPFQMPTSTDRLPVYTQYGIAFFEIDSKAYKLNIYQNHKYKETLFLPFYDLTNDDTTYGGGRYLDLAYPKNGKIKIDFNRAYHPYCAYSDQYSCPIPPAENRLDIAIPAGVKLLEKFRH